MATEVVSTIRASGGDYSSLSAWEAGEQANLVTADEIAVAEGYDDWASGLDDAVTISGWTVDATRYPVIRAAPGEKWTTDDSDGFRIRRTSNGVVINSATPFLRVEGLAIYIDSPTSESSCIRFHSTAGFPASSTGLIKDCYLRISSGTGGSGTYYGVRLTDNAGNITLNTHQTIAVGIRNTQYPNSTSSYAFYAEYGTLTARNCAAHQSANGFARNSSGNALNCYNCVSTSYEANTAYFKDFNANGGSIGGDYNASADSTAPGGNSVTGIASADEFVDAANGDFHLDAASNLIGAGTNLYSFFTEDVDGDTWPSAGAWDIGADHYVAAGGGAPTISSPGVINVQSDRATPQVTLTF